ncbi:MAG: NUDIX domain-containing protein [Planctomycetes bacterium]|nr:NUDIX domain-containing protein [Planctomycetota bacterium]
MSSNPKEGVVAVVFRQGRFLVIQRAAGILAGGAWCFVGGAIEPGETQEQALVREFREEVGGTVLPVQCVWRFESANGRLRLFWWVAELPEGELTPNPAEVAEIRWCTTDELLNLPNLLETNRHFVLSRLPEIKLG